MLITRDDIQRIGDEDTLLHFLEEKLNLPVPDEATLAQIALPLPLPFLGLDESIADQIIDCQDFSGLPQDGLSERRPFLIRLRYESNYSEVIRAVAEGLHQKNTNPLNLFFFCPDESFQPFAFAYFNDSESEDWQAAVLNILAWIQENTHIHTSSEHELPIGFFASEPSEDFDDKSDIFGKEAVTATSGDENDHDDSPTSERTNAEENADNNIFANTDDGGEAAVELWKIPNIDEVWEILNDDTKRHKSNSTSSENLLTKLENVGVPLGQHWNTYSEPAVQPGYSEALILDESKYNQLRADSKSRELIKPVVCIPRRKGNHRWNPEWKHIIWIASSEFKRWPWSKANSEAEAERIFANTYPVISRHVYGYKNELKNCSPKSRGKFYGEIPKRPVSELNQKFSQPKIVYPAQGVSMSAGYDKSGSLILQRWTCFIPTKDLSLLAMLNSVIFDWYAKVNFQFIGDQLAFNKRSMVTFPVVNRTGTQKAELSDLVQQILNAPNSPNVSNLEEEINMLVYDLYDLTSAEIALIEKGNSQ